MSKSQLGEFDFFDFVLRSGRGSGTSVAIFMECLEAHCRKNSIADLERSEAL